MDKEPFSTEISRHIWDSKYRFRDGEKIYDADIGASWRRVAAALAGVEAPGEREHWERRFYAALEGFRFLPGGRIQAGAGTGRQVTLFNCFVMGIVKDSIDGIFSALKEGALTMQQGGGVGYDFSTLRPKGTPAQSVGSVASGPVSFMDIWDSMCATLLSTGARRGAMMGTLRCDHPDIEEFIDAKRDKHKLRHFNVSVLVTDEFMRAVDEGADWPLVFPFDKPDAADRPSEVIMRRWPGHGEPVPCRVVRRVGARALWRRIMRATYDYAEPGVLFIDRINDLNNLYYREYISATNPCGEIPLPPYGACDLGSINLTRFVDRPFTPQASIDMAALRGTVEVAVRMMDNVIDLSEFPLARQAEQAHGSRRIGLGITGLADALIMLGHRYGEPDSFEFASRVMREVCHGAYRYSIELAREKGAFPFLDTDAYLAGTFVSRLPEDIRTGIARHGIRNSHVTAIAPTGTISLLANNISSGLEPVYGLSYERWVLEFDGTRRRYPLTDYAYALWQQHNPADTPLPPYFVAAHDVDPEAHLGMQAAIQPYIDNAISKTINIPLEYDFDAFEHLYAMAYSKGLKGCTTFRPNVTTGEVLATVEETAHCCTAEREAD